MNGLTTRLGDLGATYGGLTGKSKIDFGTGSARFVTFMEVLESSRLRGRRLEPVRVLRGERQNSVARGDVLFNGSSETPEDVALSSVVDFDPAEETYLNSFCFGFRIKRLDLVDPTYLAYFFRSSEGRSLVLSLAQGATRYNIAKTKFLDLEIEFPRIGRQREIVGALTVADDVVNSLERLIAKKQAMKQGMVQQLLTGDIRLPGFTQPWAEVRLGDHVTYVKTVALSREQLDTTSPVRYLHYGDIHKSSESFLPAVEMSMPRAARALAGSAGRLQVGDLVFADASEDPEGVGKSIEVTSVPSEGLVAGLHTIAARFDKSVLADRFKGYLQLNPAFRKSLMRLAVGTKVLATTRSYISSVALMLPTVEEQREIAAVLVGADNEIRALEERLKSAQNMKQGMMQELLTGRKRLPVEGSAA
jgi:type I restriction enzyme S subunit